MAAAQRQGVQEDRGERRAAWAGRRVARRLHLRAPAGSFVSETQSGRHQAGRSNAREASRQGLLVTVCRAPVLLVHTTVPWVLTDAGANGWLLLTMRTVSAVEAAVSETSTVPIIGA